MSTNYAIITPVYNESEFIERNIISVVEQSIIPKKWIIVDDDSTDDTANIIQKYSLRYPWIKYHYRKKKSGQTYYASNVYAILEGYKQLNDVQINYLAILDADIILCNNYYESIFRKFEAFSELGIATGIYLEAVNGKMMEAYIDRRSTPKALQVFRKECYDKIGGFLPLPNGGEDSCAEVSARKLGWQTWSFTDIKVIHLRPAGTGDGRSIIKARFRLGKTDYGLGTHPFFMLFKCFKRCFVEHPRVLSGLARFIGYLSCYLKLEKRIISRDIIKYLRKEQLIRLRATIGFKTKLWRPSD